MFIAPTPTPQTNGAPGLTAWLSTRPASTSALATTITAATLAGAVRAGVGRRRPDHRDAELGAGDHLAGAVLVEEQRRHRHRVDAEAVGLAGQRRHLLHLGEDVAVARRDQQRLARAAHHGVDLDQVVDGLRRVFRQAHAHHEVDVGQLLAKRGHALDVGAADAATLARVGVAHVEDVGAGAAVGVRGVEDERLGVAAARLDRPVARRTPDGGLHELGRDAHPRAVDLCSGLREDLGGRRVPHLDAGLGEHVERRFVDAPAGVVVPDRQASCVHVAPSSLS